MVKHVMIILLTVTAVTDLTGCPFPLRGGLSFDIDLGPLSVAQGAAKATDLPITGVTVTISRNGFDTIVSELTVSNGHAAGSVGGLLEGYWHVKVDAYSGTAKTYTGDKDVKVIAGLAVQVTILFDPVIEESHTGSINFDVGINPAPGFRILDQVINQSMFSATRNELYLLDSSQRLIAVYDGATFSRVRDIAIAEAPRSICLGVDENEFILGYPSGQIYRLGIESGTFTLAGDVLMDVVFIVGITPNIVLTTGLGSYDEQFKSFNLGTGQIITTKTSYYSFQTLVYDANVSTAYAFTTGVSPSDLYRVKLNPDTGEILEANDSRYHGDYNFGSPIRIFNEGQRILTSSGNMFTCAALADTDLTYAGSIAQTYKDLAADDTLGYLYLLNTGSYGDPPPNPKLIIMKEDNYFVQGTVDLVGTPMFVFNAREHIMVIAQLDGRYYTKVLSKLDLGLL